MRRIHFARSPLKLSFAPVGASVSLLENFSSLLVRRHRRVLTLAQKSGFERLIGSLQLNSTLGTCKAH